MERSLLLHTQQPPKTCGSPEPADIQRFDVRVAVLLVTLAGAVILLLLYKLLQLRHRLRLSRARYALEYFSFYHTATYTLKHIAPCQDPPVKNRTIPETTPPVLASSTVTPLDVTLEPPSLVPSPLPLPPPSVLPPPPVQLPPTLPPAPPVLALPLPVIHTNPPSPHLSWGACSEADVYSRIGTFQPSRLSSLSNNSKVILFEHSSL
ncbi:hypothetical protein EXN66_Car018004 [Channa argus]|uniref:Uncharacterized protein n=1 Tax=Channa argus TaxID=215402 RepID=A0A6G1QJP5_CHAAH|nr:hypothetical protein EXN66_Car018004 [Channa argus]KAK2888561.1 hypothetical protein Q8A73_020009 [Channa argus]